MEGGKAKPVKFIKEGQMFACRIAVEHNICMETFKDFDQFGRFMLRDEGQTIGMGMVKALRN